LGKQNSWTKVFAGIGLFGLVASFHGVIISYSRQLYAVARDGYLPKVLARVNTRHRTPHVAMIVGSVVLEDWVYPAQRRIPGRDRMVRELTRLIVDGTTHRGRS